MQCSVEGCEREAKVRGMCKPHYVREWKRTNVSIEKREGNELYAVWCSKRKGRVPEWETFETFKKDVGEKPTDAHKLRKIDSKKPFGPGNVEWRLTFVPKGENEPLKAYVSRAMRLHNLRLKYGLSAVQFETMLEAQKDACAICELPETRSNGRDDRKSSLAVDHDHKTGKVRGLLCSTCNTSLGGFKDDPKLLSKAIEYLKHHSEKTNETTQGQHKHAD